MAERPEDLNLPNAVVGRIIKEAIPEGVNVSKEARLAISKAASVFVLYATSCSNNFALKGKRKTISAQDVLNAMEEMEFEQFIDPLTSALEAFRKEMRGKKTAAEKKKKEKEAVNSSLEEGGTSGEKEESDEEVTYQGEENDGFIITVNDDNEEGEEVEEDVEEVEDG
ncbi:hypothetical protein C0Q70_17635 [Pomacea canaliculata]|uniref:DNA polymerase epsilon subunit 3 n=1 Tax=Pomacea canaliculata TaxID=400727 RepID=A0A2T7NKY6_POMCA|nr:DNA polymerase epsilon subunit 3-like [Pomacea canaliculata]PVD21833.1 hypothetical protein C0Q70_17635 [Pomacea canaliculata]